MALITVNRGESIESALRRFKHQVIREGIIQDVRRHAFLCRRPRKRS